MQLLQAPLAHSTPQHRPWQGHCWATSCSWTLRRQRLSGSRCGFTGLGCSGHRTGVLQGDSSIHFGGVVFVDASHQGRLLVLGSSGEKAELAIHLQNGGPLVLQATFLCLNGSYIQIVGCSGLLIARSILLANRL